MRGPGIYCQRKQGSTWVSQDLFKGGGEVSTRKGERAWFAQLPDLTKQVPFTEIGQDVLFYLIFQALTSATAMMQDGGWGC